MYNSKENLSAHDLRELTESYALEARESWGSWSGAGGGGAGVRFKRRSFSPRGSGSNVANGMPSVAAARDLDLEKLGGSYR